MLTVQNRGGLLIGGVAAGIRLGQAVAAEQLTLGERHQILLLLRLVAVGHERIAHQRVVDRADHAVARAYPRQLLDRDHVAQVVHARATPLLGHEHAEQPELTHLLGGRERELVSLVEVSGDRPDLFLGERAYHLAHRELLFGKLEADTGRGGEGLGAHAHGIG